MKAPYLGLKKKIHFFMDANAIYKQLKRHLDKQPVGYPGTLTGTEMRILKAMFTAEEAKAALTLSYKFESAEALWGKAKKNGFQEESRFLELLSAMEKKGTIFLKFKENKPLYALHPFVIGMFEMQVKELNPAFFLDTHKYMIERFALEYLSTEVPQMRVVPVNRSLPLTQNIATYDQIREIVERANGKICITDCICKKGKDIIGDPCKVTDRREVCMGFRDFSDSYVRNNWGRAIDKEEAMEILNQNEKEGLVLIGSAMQEPQYVCSCCNCCCGIMEMINFMPRPVDFSASNFYAVLDESACNGCKRCVKRCQMNAIAFDEKKRKATPVDLKRCIGCGLCVPTCKQGAIQLKKKEVQFVPPKDHDALYETIMQHKKSAVGQLVKMSKAVIGMKV
jgi:ferredoxin